jgi:hypothetical protein
VESSQRRDSEYHELPRTSERASRAPGKATQMRTRRSPSRPSKEPPQPPASAAEFTATAKELDKAAWDALLKFRMDANEIQRLQQTYTQNKLDILVNLQTRMGNDQEKKSSRGVKHYDDLLKEWEAMERASKELVILDLKTVQKDLELYHKYKKAAEKQRLEEEAEKQRLREAAEKPRLKKERRQPLEEDYRDRRPRGGTSKGGERPGGDGTRRPGGPSGYY